MHCLKLHAANTTISYQHLETKLRHGMKMPRAIQRSVHPSTIRACFVDDVVSGNCGWSNWNQLGIRIRDMHYWHRIYQIKSPFKRALS